MPKPESVVSGQLPVKDADYYIKLFKSIPAERWIVGQTRDRQGRCCAIGHCAEADGLTGPLDDVLRHLFTADQLLICRPAAYINDGQHIRFRQSTPRARILAALNDVKALIPQSAIATQK